MIARYPTRDRFEPGRGYTQEDWDEVSDNPPITEEQLRQGKPFKEVFPELYESIQRARGRPQSDDPKKVVTLRLPQSVLERWQNTPDWRARMAELLSKSAP